MTTPIETFQDDRFEPAAPPPSAAISPNNPPFTLLSAIGVWLVSMALLFVANPIVVAIYVLYAHGTTGFTRLGTIVETDQREVIFVSLLGVIPAHIMTLVIIWMVVTQYGRYSFWQTIGWSWSPGFGLRLSIGISFAMLIIGFMLAWLIGGGETQLDQLIASSMKARVATAVLATFTAPLVEEMVYRGVLFPAIQRATGAVWGVAAVSFLFALVHVVQYSNNLGVISVIVLLSIVLTSVRAFTGRLLPCFTIHLIFNAVQAALLLAEPFLRPLFEKAKAPAMILTYAFQCFS